jgi:hypothetical protein
MLIRVIASAALMLSPLAAAHSAPTDPTRAAPNYNSGDRNERICEKITPVGSRLAAKRFCGTRAEWEEKRRLDREEVEKVQKNTCVRHAGC